MELSNCSTTEHVPGVPEYWLRRGASTGVRDFSNPHGRLPTMCKECHCYAEVVARIDCKGNYYLLQCRNEENECEQQCWVVCSGCDKQKVGFRTWRSVDDHSRKFHRPVLPETDGQSHIGFPGLDESMVVGSNANEDSDDNSSSNPNICSASDNYISRDPSVNRISDNNWSGDPNIINSSGDPNITEDSSMIGEGEARGFNREDASRDMASQDVSSFGYSSMDVSRLNTSSDQSNVSYFEQPMPQWDAIVPEDTTGFPNMPGVELSPFPGHGKGMGHEREASRKYFEANFCGGVGSNEGKKALVVRAVTRACGYTKYKPGDLKRLEEEMSDTHVDLGMKIVKMCFKLSSKDAQLFAEILHGSYHIGCEDGYTQAQNDLRSKWNEEKLAQQETPFKTVGECSDQVNQFMDGICEGQYKAEYLSGRAYRCSVIIPSKHADIRRIYTAGPRSIKDNLPHPRIITSDKHAYISLKDCVRDFLGHRYDGRQKALFSHIDPEISRKPFENVDHPSKLRRAAEILHEVLGCEADKKDLDSLVCYIFLWSDDVECNTSKTNRGSVWIMTMTIATHWGDGHSLTNTYPVAVGKKGDPHDDVVKEIHIMLDELKNSNEYYIGSIGRKAKIRFVCYAVLQDQPERRGYNHLMLGSAAYAARTGVSACKRL